MQKFVGFMLSNLAGIYIFQLSNFDWRFFIAVVLVGLGGVIYGDAEE